MKIKARLPKGMRDIEAVNMRAREHILDILKKHFERYGFDPLETPAMEYWDILTGKYGAEAERLVYHLVDHGGRELGLRYDLTVPLARYVASHKQLLLPFKRYQVQPVWRAEKPQKGRYREFYQCDVDVVGSPSMLVDAELVALTAEVMSEIGFTHYEVRINSRNILTAFVEKTGIDSQKTADVCLSLDKVEKVGWDKVTAELMRKGYSQHHADKLRELTSIEGDNEALLREFELLFKNSPTGSKGVAELQELLEHLQCLTEKVSHVRLDPLLTRGLDYYTGPVYETFLTDRSFPSLGGGGRYDGLVGIFSDQSIPAAGTSFGLDRIVAALQNVKPSLNDERQHLLVVHFSDETRAASLQLVAALRAQGFSTEFYYEKVKLKKQFSYANKRNIPLVVVLGPDEYEAGEVTVKDLKKNEQYRLKKAELIQWIARRFSSVEKGMGEQN